MERTAQPAPGLMRAVRAPLLTATAVAAAWAMVAVVDPYEPGTYPVCPSVSLLGVACPACGGLRAAHSLASGDLGSALDHNALFVLALPLLAAAWLWWLRRSARRQRVRLSATALGGLVAVAVAFAVARNLPFGPGLAP